MSLFFPNAKIRVYRYTETGDYDDDGEPEFVNKFIAEYTADIQKKRFDNENSEHGNEQKNQYIANLEPSANVQEEDIILYNGQYFKVYGRPALWDHFLNHMELELIELRVPPIKLED